MKKTFSLLAICATLLLASCSKEKSIDSSDPDGPNNGGNTPKGLLVKTVIQLGQTDSSVTNFSYDGEGRLSRMWLSGNQNVMSDPGEVRVERDAQGRIKAIGIRDEVGATTDSRVYTVHFNTSTNRYISKVVSETYQGVLYKDSIVYNYNANGQITEEVYYVSVENSPYADWSKTEFTYGSNGNLTEYKGYFRDPMSSNYVQASHIAIEYDNKPSPLVLGAEGILLDQINFVSPNNVTRATVTDLEEPSNSEVVSYAYEYNDKNKPATANITFQSVGLPIPATFYYQ